MALQHLRSSTANKRPLPANMADGQVAVNTNTSSPGLFVKDSASGLLKIGPTHIGTTAPNLSPASGGASGNTIGEQWLDTSGTNPLLKVWDGSAWRTIQPVTTGTVVSTTDVGTITSAMILDETIADVDISTTASIAHSKLASITAGRVLLGNSSNVPTATVVSGDITITSAGATTISNGAITNAKVSASAGIVDTKLATIATAGKVSNSATTATNGNVINAIVARDASGNFSANTIAANIIGNVTGDLTGTASAIADNTVTSAKIVDGAIVNADVNNSAAIAGTKVSPDFGSQNVVTTGANTAARFIPSGSTVPTNGLYLPAANSVAISTNGTGRLFVDASGRVLIGISSGITAPDTNGTNRIPGLQGATIAFEGSLWNNAFFNTVGNAGTIQFTRSNTTTIGNHALAANNNGIGTLQWSASDGTNYIRAAQIQAAVDGTPGTDDMPGRLTFSTTAAGSSSPTERMRIRSDGNISVGGSGAAFVTLYNQGPITGSTTAYANYTVATAQSDVTNNALAYRTQIGTAAAAFTLTTIEHYRATQGTFGAGSAVTNQYAFHADSTLAGATNNYGFYSNLASATGRWNFFANGTADNYFAGNVGIGITAPTSQFHIRGTGDVVRLDTSGSEDQDGVSLRFHQRDTTIATNQGYGGIEWEGEDSGNAGVRGYIKGFSEGSAGEFGLRFATQGSGASSPIERMRIASDGKLRYSPDGPIPGTSFTNSGTAHKHYIYTNTASNAAGGVLWLANFTGQSGLTIARSNGATTADRGAVSSGDAIGSITWAADDGGTGGYHRAAQIIAIAEATASDGSCAARLQFNTAGETGLDTERMRIDSLGRVAIGTGSTGSVAFRVANPITNGTTAYQAFWNGEVQTDATSAAYYHRTVARLSATPFSIGSLHHYSASLTTLGGATLTNQYGFHAENNLVGATNNFGFYGNIPAATGRWNFFANGTAPNYFAGDVRSNTVFTARTSPVNSNVTATATAASLLDGLRTGTPTANINLTLPTGANMDAAFQELQNNQSFEWSLINLAAATHVITVVANTTHTVVGNMGVAAASSGRFLTRKTAANTFITYRIA